MKKLSGGRSFLVDAFLISVVLHLLVLFVLSLWIPEQHRRRSKSVCVSFNLEKFRQTEKRAVGEKKQQPEKKPVVKKLKQRRKETKAEERHKEPEEQRRRETKEEERYKGTKQKEIKTEKSSEVSSERAQHQAPDARAVVENKQEIDRFLSQILYRIEKAKHYPLVARRRRMEGVVKCKFTILRDGSLKRVGVIRKSRFPVLDRAAVAAVKKGVPYPAFPGFLKGSTFTSTVDIKFELN